MSDEDCRWAMTQLLYYLPDRLDTEASRVFDRARMWLDEHPDPSTREPRRKE